MGASIYNESATVGMAEEARNELYKKESMQGLQELIDELMDFQVKTFPTSNVVSKLYHLAKEIPELISELELDSSNQLIDKKAIESEYADCFLLLFGSAAIYGLDAAGIARVVREKLEINRNRKWGIPDANGVVQHIKE